MGGNRTARNNTHPMDRDVQQAEKQPVRAGGVGAASGAALCTGSPVGVKPWISVWEYSGDMMILYAFSRLVRFNFGRTDFSSASDRIATSKGTSVGCRVGESQHPAKKLKNKKTENGEGTQRTHHRRAGRTKALHGGHHRPQVVAAEVDDDLLVHPVTRKRQKRDAARSNPARRRAVH